MFPHHIFAAIDLAFVPLWVTPILLLLGSAITGGLTKFGWDLIEKLIPPFAKLSAYLKPFAVAVLGVIINSAASFLNTPLPTDLHLWNATVLGSFMTAAFAWLIHKIQNDQAAKAAQSAAKAAPPVATKA